MVKNSQAHKGGIVNYPSLDTRDDYPPENSCRSIPARRIVYLWRMNVPNGENLHDEILLNGLAGIDLLLDHVGARVLQHGAPILRQMHWLAGKPVHGASSTYASNLCTNCPKKECCVIDDLM